jgi:hypothetical protein
MSITSEKLSTIVEIAVYLLLITLITTRGRKPRVPYFLEFVVLFFFVS